MFGNLGSAKLTTKDKKLLQVYDGWVYANVKAIANKVSEIQFKLYQTSYKGGEIVFTEIEQHELLDLLDRWNPFTTTNDAIFQIDSHISLAGDTFIYKERGGGKKINNLFVLDPTKVTVKPGDASVGYIVSEYDYQDNVEGKVIKETYAPEDIIPIKEPNPANPYRGKSVVEAAAQTIDTDTMAGEYNKKFFEKNAIPNSFMTTEQKLNKDQVERIEKKMKRKFGGFRNAYEMAILSGGLDIKQLQSTAKDMEFNLQQTWTRDKIMALFGNTKTSLGITDDVNRANAEATLYSWLKHTIKPRMRRITNSLNEFLVPEYGDNLILGFEEILPEDRGSLVTDVESMVGGAPILTINEARAELDYDNVTDGDVIPTGGTNVSP